MVEAALKEFDAMLDQDIDESVSKVDMKSCVTAAFKINAIAEICVSRDLKFRQFINDTYCHGGNPDIPTVFYRALANYLLPTHKPDEVWIKHIGIKYPHLYGLVNKCV